MHVILCVFLSYLPFSDEDITAVKTSLYFLKEISLKLSKNKAYKSLVLSAITLVLVTTSRVFVNKGILDNSLITIKENVISCLKESLTKVTIAVTKRSFFNVKHKSQGQFEMQVRDILIYSPPLLLFPLYLIFVVLESNV